MTNTFAEAKSRLLKTTDKLGYAIEPGIIDTVAALKLFDIVTVQSCEGHTDRGLCGPWVMLGAKNTAENTDIQKQIKLAITAAEKVKSENPHDFLKNTEYINQMEIFRKNQSALHIPFKKNILPLTTLLDEFYKNHRMDFQTRLIIENIDSTVPKLLNQGLYLQNILPKPQQLKNLINFRKEMTLFTQFLINKYSSHNI